MWTLILLFAWGNEPSAAVVIPGFNTEPDCNTAGRKAVADYAENNGRLNTLPRWLCVNGSVIGLHRR